MIGDGVVVSGTVDRLFVGDGRVLVADFKTGRNVPAALDDIPAAHLRQMAAYQAALRVIFPNSAVEAALLYTAAPVLHALPDALLAATCRRPPRPWVGATAPRPYMAAKQIQESRMATTTVTDPRSSRTCWAPRGRSSSISAEWAVRAG